jgi:dihydropteroate synthase
MSAQDTVFSQKIEQIFDPEGMPLIMGILNVTPDSFFDGGQYLLEEAWLEKATEMVAAGMDIIDIGAYSTRPGALEVSESEEMNRLLKVICSVRAKFPELLISVDTFRAAVAEKAIAAGANIINDISGGTMDNGMFEVVAKYKVPYILMHIQGVPQTMQHNPLYKNVTNEVSDFFSIQLSKLKNVGIQQVILDPGFGFGKTVEQNFQLLKNLTDLHCFCHPLLIGISRKSMITKFLNIKTKESVNGTTTLHTLALQKGAKILRVHDVKEAMEVVKMMNYLKFV